MDYTAWPTITDCNVYLTGIGITLPQSYGVEFQQRIINSIVSELTQHTRREFVASSPGTIRYFDGSGTGEMEIDDYIDITQVRVLGYLGGVGTGLSLANVWEVDRNVYPKNRLQIFQGSLPSFTRIYIDHFPVGRSNIEVTGTFGYASTIPSNVWEAVAGEYAVRVATLVTYSTTGFMEQWREADVGEILKLQVPEKYLMEHRKYKQVLDMYKLPVSKHIRLTQRLVK